jgi:hypothetical protein
MINCDKTGLSGWCNNKDVKYVQLRSQVAGPNGPTKYEGRIVAMCSGCRKANCGKLKIVNQANA